MALYLLFVIIQSWRQRNHVDPQQLEGAWGGGGGGGGMDGMWGGSSLGGMGGMGMYVAMPLAMFTPLLSPPHMKCRGGALPRSDGPTGRLSRSLSLSL